MNRRPTAIIPLATIEADLLRRGMDPDFVAAKQTIPGDLPPTVSRTEFLALQVRYGYQKAVAVIRARIELAELERELRATSQSASAMRTALDAARVGELGQAFRETAENNIRASFLRGAREGERELRQVEVRIRFDAMNPHAATFARTQSSQLITQIDDSQREAVRNLIETSVSNGRTIQDIARDIRHVVGLRDDQVTALSNYRERITERGRFTVDQIESKVRRYADALLRQRGELIARTEVLHAANQGQLETWMEAQRQGTLGNDWRKKWVLTPDELLCESCEAMEDEVAEFDEVFENELGETAMVPPLHPNCRCSLVLTKEAATERAAVGITVKYSDDQPRVPAGSPDGGQFTDGGSGGDFSQEDEDAASAELDAHYKELKEYATQQAENLGFDTERLVFTEDSKVFTVGDQQFTQGGSYDPLEGIITINLSGTSTKHGMVAIVSHEVQHDRFNMVMGTYESEVQDIIADKGDPIKPDGTLRDQYASRYPTYAAIQPHMEKNLDQLKKDDGVTPYSEAYWRATTMPDSRVSVKLAVNETLSEIASVNQTTGMIPGKKVWREFYKAVNKEAARLRRQL